MDGYVGIDIGTTNLKCLVVDQEGRLAKLYSERTPKRLLHDMEFFDIAAIDGLIDRFLGQAGMEYRIQSVGFSSIGESAVPVLDGKPLYDCPVWNVSEITSTQNQRDIIGNYCDFSHTGMVPNGLCSIDKILWMREHLPICADAQYWLPLTSYELYRKTGHAVWDYTQASRSYMFDVHKREWIMPLLDAFNLVPPGDLACMGTPFQGTDGITYAVGGHDHMVGLFGIEAIFSPMDSKEPLFYDSMGTSSVLTLITDGNGTRDYSGMKTYNPTGGCVIPGFRDQSYIITRSFRKFGSLLAYVMGLGGFKTSQAEFNAMNKAISASRPELGCVITCDGDFILGNTNTGEVNFSRIRLDGGLPSMLHSLYLYLAAITSFMRDDLDQFAVSPSPIQFVAGGGITGNDLFLKYLSTACGSPIAVLPTTEISALGAAMSGIQACGASSVVAALGQLKGQSVIHTPSSDLGGQIDEAKDIYRRMRETMSQRYGL